MEFQVGAHRYQCRKLSAFEAFDIGRKWSYVLANLVTANDLSAKTFAQGFLAFSTPIPKGDSDFTLNVCLSAVSRAVKDKKGWAPITGPNGDLRYDDIDMPTMLEIVYNVLVLNKIVDFFAIAPSTSTSEETGQGKEQA